MHGTLVLINARPLRQTLRNALPAVHPVDYGPIAKSSFMHVGQLTGRKDAIVSNVALTRVGLGLGLQRFIALPLDAYEFADGLPGAVRRFAWLLCVKVALRLLELAVDCAQASARLLCFWKADIVSTEQVSQAHPSI